MGKNTKGLIAVLVVGAVAFAVYHFTNQNASTYAKKIVRLGGADSYAGLISFDKGYLKAWASALGKGQKSFVYNNENYNTNGGKKIVS